MKKIDSGHRCINPESELKGERLQSRGEPGPEVNILLVACGFGYDSLG